METRKNYCIHVHVTLIRFCAKKPVLTLITYLTCNNFAVRTDKSITLVPSRVNKHEANLAADKETSSEMFYPFTWASVGKPES